MLHTPIERGERCRVRACVFAMSTDGERADTLLVGLLRKWISARFAVQGSTSQAEVPSLFLLSLIARVVPLMEH